MKEIMTSPKTCYKFLGSQYSIENNDSSERITVKSNVAVQLEFEEFEFKSEIYGTFHTTPIRFCSRFIPTVKMVHHVEIGKVNSF